MAGKSFKTFIWAESGLSRASKNLPEMHRPDHDFGPRRMLADSVAEQGLNFWRFWEARKRFWKTSLTKMKKIGAGRGWEESKTLKFLDFY